jgi:hypothetical protein
MKKRHAMSDKLQFVAGVALVETHDKLKLVGHFRRRHNMRFLTLVTGSLLIAGMARAAQFTESDWQVAFNNRVTHGKLEFVITTGRVDILTDTHAIEVDYARNYRAAIKQALQYAAETKLKPGLALIIDGKRDTLRAVDAARKQCRKAGVTFWLVNEYVSVNDLANQKPKAVSPPSGPQGQEIQSKPPPPVEPAYWLNTKSAIRHNRSCRWFGRKDRGRPCGPNEGRPCKRCGG